MSRKDYELIARIISNLPLNRNDRWQVAQRFAKELAQGNPRFDAGRFLAACNAES